MKTLLCFILISLIICNPIVGQERQTATGTVFHDLNGNVTFDAGEPGIANVAVSNGTEVALTDADGRYTIEVEEDVIVFVIKPGDFNYPVNEFNLPQFYYIHKPEGSPDQKYPGLPPTGALPSNVDFPLIAGSNSDEFSIIVFSDPQAYNETQIGYYDRSIVEELAGVQGPAFGITLGDIVGDRLDFFEPTNQATARIGLPWFHVIGNHDMNFDAKKPDHADETFERVYGPANYAFNHGKVHFIIINNVIFPNDLTARFYVGGLREAQFDFIENTLKHVPVDHLVVLCMHIPLYNVPEWGETFLDVHRDRLFQILSKHPYTFSMSGHMHSQKHYFFDVEENWQHAAPHHHYTVGTSSGDWWSGKPRSNGVPDATMYDGTPQGYNIMHFKGNTYAYDYKVVGEPDTYKMRLYGPKVVPVNQHFRGEFYVNFFQGSKNDTVEFRVNDNEWRRMRHTVEFDPFVCAMRYEWDHADVLPEGTRPSNPVLSHHLWRTRVPTNVPPGRNTIYIRVKDKQGRSYEDVFTFEAVE
jgi:hypothetical protein